MMRLGMGSAGERVMKTLSISGRIYLCVGIVLALLAISSATSFFSTSQLASVFNDYRSTARQTLVMGDLSEDLFEARIAAFSYRVAPSGDKAAAVSSNIDEIQDIEKDAKELFAGDPGALEILDEAISLSAEYKAAFLRMTALQNERDTVVATLSETGPRARKQLTSIMETAFRDGDGEAAYYAGIAQQELVLGRFYAERFLLNNSETAYDRMAGHLAAAEDGLDTLLGALENRERRDNATRTLADIGTYVAAAGKVREIIRERNAIRTGILDTVGPKLQADYERILDEVVDRQNALGPAGSAQAERALVIVSVLAIAALLIGSAFAFVVTRGTSRTLRDTTDTMTQLANGELDIEIDGAERTDELGAMARALGVFKDNAVRMRRLDQEKEASERAAQESRHAMMQELRRAFGSVVSAAGDGDFSRRVDATFADNELNELAAGINDLVERLDTVLRDVGEKMRALAGGDLCQRIDADYRGAFGELSESVNATGNQLSQIVGRIQTAAEEVKNAASEISSGTADLSSRTEQAASNLEETAASTEEMAATVRQNADNAKNASQLASGADASAKTGGQVVEQAVHAMAGIEDSARKITDIISVIDEIAFQTNLLALNASVEAARAGEAGKGFAVVAQEVRQLAQRSSQASDDIKRLIQDSNGQVKDGVRLVNRAGEALTEIVGSIGKVAGIVEEISSASQEQAIGVQEISGSVNTMDEMTQQNSALVEESTAAAKALSDQAATLAELMAFFKLRGGAAAARSTTRHVKIAQPGRKVSPVPAAAEDDDGWAEF